MELTTTKQSPAKTGKRTLKELLVGDDFKNAIAAVLPKHLTPDRFVRVAITATIRTPLLAECDQHSFFQALMQLSQFGLEPDGRRAHLIPFRNNKRGTVECQLLLDYKGLVELAMRSGTVANIHADTVCENDEFDYDRGVLNKHRIDFRKPRGQVYAVYALCRFKDGTEKCEVMTKEDVEAIRARSRAAHAGPWQTDWNEMAKKTVFRRLSKWLTLSPEFRDAVDTDDKTETALVRDAGPSIPMFEIPPPALPEPVAPILPPPHPEYAVPEPEPTQEAPIQPEPRQDTDPGWTAPKAQPALAKDAKDRLAEIITSAGYNWDQFKAFLVKLGDTEAADLPGFADMDGRTARKYVNAAPTILRELGTMFPEVKGGGLNV